MTFVEIPFVAFFGVVYALWFACRRHYNANLFLLLAASLVFYGYHRWSLLFLVLAYCLVDWAVGYWMQRSGRPTLVLAIGVGFNLLVLGYWKYAPMLAATAAELARISGIVAPPMPSSDWTIPFGISFYSFTGIAYMVEVYRGTVPPERHLGRFCLYKMFFPQLVAGPILRPRDFLAHLQPGAMPTRVEAPLEASLLLARGYFKKLVLADRIALGIDPFFSNVSTSATEGVWALPYVYLYALQIYFDFSGYTDIARGLGLLFGFRWPLNFDAPYLATSITDFWRRWHITLSEFLRDYLYVPLGGNRGSRWRTYLNLMLTMLLGGLWHGASWSFMLWGALHGTLLTVHRMWSGCQTRRWVAAQAGVTGLVFRWLSIGLTFHCVCAAWCFFRLTVLNQSLACLKHWIRFDADKMFVGGSGDVSIWALLGVYFLGSWIAQSLANQAKIALERRWFDAPLTQGLLWGSAVALILLSLCLSPGGAVQPFIYFQF
jgi:alginate O-acetyltransferase complex protein AlgI